MPSITHNHTNPPPSREEEAIEQHTIINHPQLHHSSATQANN
jgi:hypothetical protein